MNLIRVNVKKAKELYIAGKQGKYIRIQVMAYPMEQDLQHIWFMNTQVLQQSMIHLIKIYRNISNDDAIKVRNA